MTLRVEQLSAGYRQQPVLHDISFTVEGGEMVSLIGLNGAGKSTLLKTLLGLLSTQQGELHYDGLSQREEPAAFSRHLAYIPETPVLYEELTLKEHIEMTALGYNIPLAVAMERAQPLLELFRLDKELHWLPIHFSKGMQQKVMILCALITNADLYLIDEPFLGLDPLAIRDFTALLEEEVMRGKSVIFTTHLLDLAEKLSDRFLILKDGHLVADGDLEALRAQFNKPSADLAAIYFALSEEGAE